MYNNNSKKIVCIINKVAKIEFFTFNNILKKINDVNVNVCIFDYMLHNH